MMLEGVEKIVGSGEQAEVERMRKELLELRKLNASQEETLKKYRFVVCGCAVSVVKGTALLWHANTLFLAQSSLLFLCAALSLPFLPLASSYTLFHSLLIISPLFLSLAH